MLRRFNSIPASANLVLTVAGALLIVACGSEPLSPAAPGPVVAGPASDVGATAEEGSFGTSSSTSMRGFGCSFPAAGETVFTYNSQSVISSSGKETVTCRGRVSSPPARTLVEWNVNCFLPLTGQSSNISQVKVYPTGAAKLKCQSK